jgi:hypothetical protein
MNIIGSIVGGALLVLAALLVNAGYVYKTSCPSGTSWHYSLDDSIPYTRQAAEPCHIHSATRVALSSIGVAKIKDTPEAEASTTGEVANQRAADTLRSATSDITAEYAQEQSLVTQIQNKEGSTAERQAKAAQLVIGEMTHFRAIKSRLDRPVPDISDPELIEARRLLSRWLAVQMNALRIIVSAKSASDWKAKADAALAPILPVVQRLETLSFSIRQKYPEVSSWEFLRNS